MTSLSVPSPSFASSNVTERTEREIPGGSFRKLPPLFEYDDVAPAVARFEVGVETPVIRAGGTCCDMRERICSAAKIAARGTCDAEYPNVTPIIAAIPVNT